MILPSIAYPALLQASGSQPGLLVQLMPFLLIFGIFYFLWIGPMRKRQKALQALIDGLKKGDKVITNGGLWGEVAAVEEQTVFLKLGDVKVKVSKSAIAGFQGEGDPGASG